MLSSKIPLLHARRLIVISCIFCFRLATQAVFVRPFVRPSVRLSFRPSVTLENASFVRFNCTRHLSLPLIIFSRGHAMFVGWLVGRSSHLSLSYSLRFSTPAQCGTGSGTGRAHPSITREGGCTTLKKLVLQNCWFWGVTSGWTKLYLCIENEKMEK